MPILIVLGLLPTLSFYFYVLVQFWKEAKRRRHHDACVATVSLHSVRAPAADSVAADRPRSRSNSGSERTERSARAEIAATYLKNRLSVVPSGTGGSR
jgi:hypothetical protein